MVREGQDERRLSVLHVCAPASVGGLERVVQGLAIGTSRIEHEVTVLAVVDPGRSMKDFVDPLRANGVRTVLVELPGRAYFREVRTVAGYLDELAPDILHSHGLRSDVLHSGSAARRGVATITTIHGFSQMGRRASLADWWHRRVLRRLDGLVAVSTPLAKLHASFGVPEERVHIIHNAWTAPQESLTRQEARRKLDIQDDETPLIGWVGRLVPVKGADIFLRALAKLGGTPWAVSMIGDGPEHARLRKLAAELGVSGRVRFHGPIPDASMLFPAFDLFVLSSRSEGSPMVLLEAMGHDIPVMATEVGGIPQMLVPPGEGWLVTPESPEALSDAIRHALTDTAEARRRGRRAGDRARTQFGEEQWIAEHMKAYRSAIAIRSQR